MKTELLEKCELTNIFTDGDLRRALSREIDVYNIVIDDLNDLDCIEYCRLTACLADAAEAIKKKVTYICNQNGGRGVVREYIDYLIQ